MHYLYRITNQINKKVYIGQTVNDKRRWGAHKSYAKNPEKTGQYVHRAMAKYGIENFAYEVIVTCRTQDDANEIEDVLIKQYNSRNKDKGYNLNAGGFNGEHSDETIEKIRQATFQQIAEKGHPAQGTKRTPEQLLNLSKARQEHPVEYTDEIRQRMSEAHVGLKDSEETKQRKSESIKAQWQVRGDYDSKKCQAPGCEVSGKAKYKIIDGIRYCNKHGLRMLRYNRLDTLAS